jgi:hypothetical protein
MWFKKNDKNGYIYAAVQRTASCKKEPEKGYIYWHRKQQGQKGSIESSTTKNNIRYEKKEIFHCT